MSSFKNIKLPFRPPKPRQVGFTMVLDKGMGIQALTDFLNTCSAYVDLVKFGWGTSMVLPGDIVNRKIELITESGVLVCPGGTLTEIAYIRNSVDQFLNEANDLKFTCIEVSDGIIKMPHENKLDLIKKARNHGFIVISEVGKKFPVEDKRYSIDERTDNAIKELEAGSFKVIIEARESGSCGIFDEEGEVIPEYVEKLVSRIGIHNIIFEAPRVMQQQWLISNLGNSVNLGNVFPEDCINLETLRCGLRAGTLKEYHLDKVSVFIENGVSGALHATSKNDVIVVVDALRASATIVTALASGIKSVKPVTSTDECVGELTAGERGGKKIPTLDLDNSPLSFKNGDFAGKKLTLTSTNGTECIKTSSSHNSPVLIGSLLNAKAVAARALELAHSTERNITVVMAGRNNLMANEDLISASEIVSYLQDCTLKGYIKPVFSNDFIKDFLESESGKNLTLLGKEDDVLFSAQKDIYDIVPEYKEGLLVNSNPKGK